jgi:aspartate racemase
VRTIGVLGGIGPQATMRFEDLVHRVSQELVPRDAMRGYPPLVVSYCRFPPFVADESGAPAVPRRPSPELLDTAAKLGSIVDFLVVTSNGTHAFQREIEDAAGREVLSMIDLALADVARRAWRHVGVVGFGKPLVYTEPLERKGLSVETLPDDLQAPLDRAIYRVMEGRAMEEESRLAHAAIAELRSRSVDGIVLGCTEIAPLLGDDASEPDLLDPLPLLARAAVLRALDRAHRRGAG